jgi:hypothetical protein
MRGGVIGQVSQVIVGSTMENRTTEALVMLRLERHDPHLGRTSIHEVRILGDESIGFASVGDWVEATGRQKRGYVNAIRCVNHTTGGIYAPSVARRHRMLIGALFFLVIVAIMVTVFVIIVHKSDAHFRDIVRRNEGSQQELCLQSGAPPTLCQRLTSG